MRDDGSEDETEEHKSLPTITFYDRFGDQGLLRDDNFNQEREKPYY
jgi:hypothetical protein